MSPVCQHNYVLWQYYICYIVNPCALNYTKQYQTRFYWYFSRFAKNISDVIHSRFSTFFFWKYMLYCCLCLVLYVAMLIVHSWLPWCTHIFHNHLLRGQSFRYSSASKLSLRDIGKLAGIKLKYRAKHEECDYRSCHSGGHYQKSHPGVLYSSQFPVTQSKMGHP